ncbi:hypothetical protein LZ198_19520 [Myxococcus sp. K15C18031901]|uniref:hypothetical protein n=1 Tax=Myxococcus dinghuensis TaxID=2906761 RepID=UPI0020A7291A|nr:hypothetical protein [Myxococcus dinghuensis]MCP3101069.1 hypothetical protein [Myxococcus dinghuensis]
MRTRSSAPMAPVARLLAAALLVGGCTKDEASPGAMGNADERTLQKLRQEVDRVNQGGRATAAPEPVRAAPNAQLAGLAAAQTDMAPQKLNLPEPNDTVHVDTVAMKLTGLEASHSVKGSGKLSMTTEDQFLRVQLVTQNVGEKPASLDLDEAKVVDAKGTAYGVARDVQVLAGTRPLRRTWGPDERTDMVLLFELPPQALRESTLGLVIPGTGGEVRIPLR